MLQEEEFKLTFTKHYSSLYNVSLNIIRDQDLAHDAVQDVFTKLWNKRKDLMLSVPIEIYLRKAVVNTSLNFLKQNTRQVYLDSDFEFSYEDNAKIDQDNFMKLLEQGIGSLSPKIKTIFILSRMEGLDNQEIADHLNISKKTVENQLSIALKKLKEYFETQRSQNPDLFHFFMISFF